MGMTSRRFLAAVAALGLICPAAQSFADDLDCDAASVLPAPAGFAERCGLALPPESYGVESEWVPGDTAFYKNNFPAPLNLSTAPLPTLTFTTIGPNAQPLFAMAFDLTGTNLYAVDNTSRQLGTLDQTTAVFTPIGVLTPNPAGFTVTGLTFDPTTGTAYFTATNGATANLYTINLANAALTLIGPITGFPFTIDIAIDGTGQMWGHEINFDQLISINKATGAGAVIGPTGMNANFAQGMMYDITDDTLYGCAFVIVPAQQGQLVTFDRVTGAATIVGGPVPQEMECAFHGTTVPDIAVDPASLSSFQEVDTQVVLPLDITNNGTGNLDWTIEEAPLPPLRRSPRGFVFYTDRPTFDAENPGLPIEDFEDTLVPPGGVAGCPAPFDATTNNACFATGSILPGIALQDNPLNDTGGGDPNGLATLGAGFAGSTSDQVVANTFVDSFELLFDPPVTSVGGDLVSYFGGGTVDITIFDENDVQITATSGTSSPGDGTFWGVQSDVLIGRINFFNTGNNAEGMDDIAFGVIALGPCANPADLIWVSASPTAGTTVPLDTDTVDVTFDSAGLTLGGIYTGVLCISSNDPDTPTVEVPLTLEVDTMPFLDGFETSDTSRWTLTVP